METIFLSVEFTASLIMRMGSVMFISLFGIELFMQMGLMKYLKPFGRPVARLANLPSESAISFLSAIGSMIAAHTIAAKFHEDEKLSKKELILTGVLNTVPFHFKEILTFQLPIVLPLLGPRLCTIYISSFILTGIIKLAFVIISGKIALTGKAASDEAFESLECDPADIDCTPRTLRELLRDTWNSRKKMFFRMMKMLTVITLIVQILINSGMLRWFDKIVLPLTSAFNLPPAVIGPVSAYIFSPTAGITYMSTLLNNQVVSDFQAITSLLAGSLVMIPLTRIRRTIPRYVAIFGAGNGLIIAGLTTGLSMLSRVLMLFWLFFFHAPG